MPLGLFLRGHALGIRFAASVRKGRSKRWYTNACVAVTASVGFSVVGELPGQLESLLASLGMEPLAHLRSADAGVRIEPIAVACQASSFPLCLRLWHTDAEPAAPIDFQASNVWAAASFILSHALELIRPLLTADEAMFAAIRIATLGAPIDSPIVVTGETGTGKELLVRLIHAASGRSGEVFSVNCAALNDSIAPLAQAADAATKGQNLLDELFAMPETTLFLDQVSELSAVSQSWVLRALKQIAARVEAGGRHCRARVVAATNRPLAPMIAKREFKRELYDRLAVLEVNVPPLRERTADIALLADYFLRIAAPKLSFTPAALKMLASYRFPGNVRELCNIVTRFAIASLGEPNRTIHSSDVRAQLADASDPVSIWKSSPFRTRCEMATQALAACDGDRFAAARKLGISPRNLRQHISPRFAPRRTARQRDV